MSQLFLERRMFQTNVVEKIKTRILYAIIFFFDIHAIDEVMWKSNAEPGKPQMTI